jgi:hypothetical protein
MSHGLEYRSIGWGYSVWPALTAALRFVLRTSVDAGGRLLNHIRVDVRHSQSIEIASLLDGAAHCASG